MGPHALRALSLGSAFAFSSLSGVDAACATGHVAATLASFPPEALSSPFYWGTEQPGGQVSFVLRAIGDDCAPSAVTISYATKDGSATAPPDYMAASGQRAVTTDPTHGGNDRQSVPVSLFDDPLVEPVLETAFVDLTGVQGGYLVPPTSAALHIVDDDGLDARLAFDTGTEYRQIETYAGAAVPVFRGGSAEGTTTVQYRLDPGPAPAPTAGSDYQAAASGTLTFAPGDRIEVIPLKLLNDRETEADENLTVTLSSVQGGVIQEGAGSMRFVIGDNEELGEPLSRFHHPRNRKTYRSSDYRIREIHVFTEDRGGSGVVKAEFALRRDLAGGGCAWWGGRGWKTRPCGKEVWRSMKSYEPDFFYIRLPELERSSGPIETYTAMSRAVDGSGNKESRYDKGRNFNTFDIK